VTLSRAEHADADSPFEADRYCYTEASYTDRLVSNLSAQLPPHQAMPSRTWPRPVTANELTLCGSGPRPLLSPTA